MGGIAQSLAVAPAELLKVQRQVGGGAATAGAGLRAAVARAGPRVLFRGLGATLLRDGVPHGVWFAAYEWAKRRALAAEAQRRRASAGQRRPRRRRRWFRRGGAEPPPPPPPAEMGARDTLLAGAFAAVVAWVVGYPFDPIKTRIQAAALQAAAGPPPGVWATAGAMLREANGNVGRAFYTVSSRRPIGTDRPFADPGGAAPARVWGSSSCGRSPRPRSASSSTSSPGASWRRSRRGGRGRPDDHFVRSAQWAGGERWGRAPGAPGRRGARHNVPIV